MFKKTFKNTALALSLALLISGCASNTTVKEPLSDLGEYENQKLDWQSCYDDFECTELVLTRNQN